MKQLQEEHRIWVNKKYPNQPPKIPAIGCLEEAGELVHALLKIEQVQLWGDDERHKLVELRVKLTDAIGDCGIYACSLCNANEWDFANIWSHSYGLGAVDALESTILLVRAATEVALNPKRKYTLQLYLHRLKTVAHVLGLNIDAIIATTWLTVKER